MFNINLRGLVMPKIIPLGDEMPDDTFLLSSDGKAVIYYDSGNGQYIIFDLTKGVVDIQNDPSDVVMYYPHLCAIFPPSVAAVNLCFNVEVKP